MACYKFFITLVLGSFIVCNEAGAVDLGSVGKTYPIAENDIVKELEKRAAQVDWGKHLNKDKVEKAVKNYKPKENLVKLPRATQAKKRTVDMSYTVPFDIKDAKGNVLYPKGFVFNPLDYIEYQKTIIVIDANDHLQVEWLKASKYAKDINTMVLITDGSYYELGETLNRPVFFATKPIIERLQLTCVPSVAKQSGRMMEIKEIDVDTALSKKKS